MLVPDEFWGRGDKRESTYTMQGSINEANLVIQQSINEVEKGPDEATTVRPAAREEVAIDGFLPLAVSWDSP